jgi:hypothetical protein
MTKLQRKPMRRAPFVVALFVAVGVMSTSSPAYAKSAAWCPQQASSTCERSGKKPALQPGQAKPKLQPAQVKGPYGGPVWRSGPWLMS